MLTASLVFTFLAFTISAVNINTVSPSLITAIIALCLWFVYLLRSKQQINHPKYFGYMLVFAAILQIYIIFVPDKLYPFYYSITINLGLCFWLIFYNLKNSSDYLRWLLIGFSVFYSLIFLLSKIFSPKLLDYAQLFFTEFSGNRHWDFGALWAFTLLILIGNRWRKLKPLEILFMISGLVFLIVSGVRSALLSFAAGITYISIKKTNINKLTFLILIVIIFGGIIVSSLNKSLFFSRPYFYQSISSVLKYPLGVGMGNFKEISLDYNIQHPDSTAYSTYTHNIILEMISGVGLFSIIFLIFLTFLIRDILKNKLKVGEGALILAVLISFTTDTTYTIPGLIWVLFMAIGTFQSNELSP